MSPRIPFDEGLRLLQNAPLEELQERAMAIRYEKHPEKSVSFVLDTNPNYTNICNVDCSFCAFYRKPNKSDAYFKTPDEVMEHLAFAQKAGMKTVLLQGGVHEGITIDYLVTLITRARKEYPDIHPHFFTAIEIYNAATVSQISVQEALQRLWDAGQRTLPGGGAEILSERVRKKIAPKKIPVSCWLDVHKTAHIIGFKSSATMMYGHIETFEDIMIHLESIRALQDKTQGFSSFVPWSYKRDNTGLRHVVKKWAGKELYFRILALSRIYLDNFPHIASSWFSEGKETGKESLYYGADDFGGTILDENVHRATNFINKTDHNGIVQMIREAGFIPVQRDSFYQIIERYDGVDTVDMPEEGKIQEKDQVLILATSQNT